MKKFDDFGFVKIEDGKDLYENRNHPKKKKKPIIGREKQNQGFEVYLAIFLAISRVFELQQWN